MSVAFGDRDAFTHQLRVHWKPPRKQVHVFGWTQIPLT